MTSLKKYSLLTFFVLSYLIMIVGVFIILLLREIGGLSLLEYIMLLVAVTSPTISAILLTGLNDGKEGLKKLLSGFGKWKVGPFWYIAGFILILLPIIVAVFYIIISGFVPIIASNMTIGIFFLSLLENLIMGPLSEEAGWRGYALPRLETRMSALKSSLVLGIIWACWHLPLYLIEPRMPFYIYIVIVIVLAILFTWAYNNTGGSLIIPIIFHFSFNATGRYITGTIQLMPLMIFYISASIMLTIYTILVIAYYGPKRLSRKPESELPFEI